MSIYQNGNVDTWTVYILTFYLSTVHFFTRITWQSIPKYASLTKSQRVFDHDQNENCDVRAKSHYCNVLMQGKIELLHINHVTNTPSQMPTILSTPHQ